MPLQFAHLTEAFDDHGHYASKLLIGSNNAVNKGLTPLSRQNSQRILEIYDSGHSIDKQVIRVQMNVANRALGLEPTLQH